MRSTKSSRKTTVIATMGVLVGALAAGALPGGGGGVLGAREAQAAAPLAMSEMRISGDVMATMLKPLFTGTQLRLTKGPRADSDKRAQSYLQWGAPLGAMGGDFEVPSAFVALDGGGSLEYAVHDVSLASTHVSRSGASYDVTFTFEEDGAEIRGVPTAAAAAAAKGAEAPPEIHLAKMALTVRITPGVSVGGRPVVAAASASFSAQPGATACAFSMRGKKVDACSALATYTADLGAAVGDAVTTRLNDGVFRANLGEAWWDEVRHRIPSGNAMWVRFDKGDALVTYAPSPAS